MSPTQGRVLKTRAVVCWGPKDAITIETLDLDPPKAGEVRVKVVACGVCHSDIHAFDGTSAGLEVKFPFVGGHEGSGIVESIGEGVLSVEPGDHVLLIFQPYCGKCVFCVSPKTNFCASEKVDATTMPDGTNRNKLKGKEIFPLCGGGCMSEYQVYPETRILKIDPKVPLETACLISCAIGTGYGTVTKIAKVDPGSTSAIWGLGPIGLATAISCKLAGCSKIIGIDINPSKFDLAKKFGVTDFINSKTETSAEKPIETIIQSMTGGLGVDFAFECIGFASTASDALNSVVPGYGKAIIVGLVGEPIVINPFNLLSAKTLTGGLFGGFKGRHDLGPLVDLCDSGKINLSHFVTKTAKLDNIHEAIDDLKKGKVLRTVILFE